MNKKSHSTHKSRRGMEKLRNVYNLIVKDRSEELSKLDKGDLAKMTFTDYKRNILHLAVSNNSQNVVKYIIGDSSLKELINLADDNEDLPIHLAIIAGNSDLYVMLKNAGASEDLLNVKNQSNLERICDQFKLKEFLEKVVQCSPTTDLINLTSNISEKSKSYTEMKSTPHYLEANISPRMSSGSNLSKALPLDRNLIDVKEEIIPINLQSSEFLISIIEEPLVNEVRISILKNGASGLKFKRRARINNNI